jgi:diguanylate cyclase (GGDEF)-like protein
VRAEVRLSAGFRPLELTSRAVSGRLSLVAVRSMAREVELSALAGGVLTHDQVTGLPNRYYLLEELHRRLTAPVGRPLACVAIWVDDLQSVAAERGIRASDRILHQVGERLQGRLRAPDLLGRFDDHGFLVLLASDMGAEQLTAVALRLREEIAFPVEHESALLSFTASMAVAPLGLRRPSLERVLSRLEAVARRAATSGGGLLETLHF